MQDFKSQITRHCDTVNKLQAKIHETFAKRDHSPKARKDWSNACDKFHSYGKDFYDLLAQVNLKALQNDNELRRFVFEFLSIDPFYFRSGYTKEHILQIIKKLEFLDHEKIILRELIITRINNGALREFRRLCRIIPKIKTLEFTKELQELSASADRNIARRALFALPYLLDE